MITNKPQEKDNDKAIREMRKLDAEFKHFHERVSASINDFKRHDRVKISAWMKKL